MRNAVPTFRSKSRSSAMVICVRSIGMDGGSAIWSLPFAPLLYQMFAEFERFDDCCFGRAAPSKADRAIRRSPLAADRRLFDSGRECARLAPAPGACREAKR